MFTANPASSNNPIHEPRSSIAGSFNVSVSEIYASYERKDYDKLDGGFFYKERSEFKLPQSVLEWIFRIFIKCEMIYFATNKTIWDVTVRHILCWISRQVSGIPDKIKIGQVGDEKNYFDADQIVSGYYGWVSKFECKQTF